LVVPWTREQPGVFGGGAGNVSKKNRKYMTINIGCNILVAG